MSQRLSFICDGLAPDGQPCKRRHEVGDQARLRFPPGWWKAIVTVDLPPRAIEPRPNPLTTGPVATMIARFRELANQPDPKHLELLSTLDQLTSIAIEAPPILNAVISEKVGRARAVAELVANGESDKRMREMLDVLEQSLGAIYSSATRDREFEPARRMVVEATFCDLHPQPATRSDLTDHDDCVVEDDIELGEIEPLSDQPGIA